MQTNPMQAYKYAISVREMQNAFTAKQVNAVLTASRKYQQRVAVDEIILVDVGTWLRQESWQDVGGWYVTFRCDPLTVSGRPEKRHELVEKFLSDLTSIWPESLLLIEEDRQDLTASITAWFKTSKVNIGD